MVIPVQSYRPTTIDGTILVSITAMLQYSNYSFDELRYQHYNTNCISPVNNLYKQHIINSNKSFEEQRHQFSLEEQRIQALMLHQQAQFDQQIQQKANQDNINNISRQEENKRLELQQQLLQSHQILQQQQQQQQQPLITINSAFGDPSCKYSAFGDPSNQSAFNCIL